MTTRKVYTEIDATSGTLNFVTHYEKEGNGICALYLETTGLSVDAEGEKHEAVLLSVEDCQSLMAELQRRIAAAKKELPKPNQE